MKGATDLSRAESGHAPTVLDDELLRCLMATGARALVTFVAVAEEGHFGRAGHRLDINGPQVSRLVQTLERELGTPLFTRTTRACQLTTRGEAVLGHAYRALAEVARMYRAAQTEVLRLP